MKKSLVTLALGLLASMAAQAHPGWAIEVHDHLAVPVGSSSRTVAITLDACGGAYDGDLISTMIAQRIPATIFVTKKWLDQNPTGTAILLGHSELFELEDHGTHHVPAVLGQERSIYGLHGQPDTAHLAGEVSGAAQAIQALTGQSPRFFRGATAVYDAQSIQDIQSWGYQVAGFSVNADEGATLPKAAIVRRLQAVQGGDVVIAHMNKPGGATAEAFMTALPDLKAKGLRFVKLSEAKLLPS